MGKGEGKGEGKGKGETNTDDVTVICGACCIIYGLYCKFPDCIGCEGSQENGYCCGPIPCTYQECICCKCASDSEESSVDSCCIWQTKKCLCIKPKNCCKGKGQFCCLTAIAALPCDAEIPCTVTVLFLTCCHNWGCKPGCCKTMGQLRGGAKVGGGAPVVAELEMIPSDVSAVSAVDDIDRSFLGTKKAMFDVPLH